MLAVNDAYLYASRVRNSTPFFQAFGPLLFGKPPVAALAEAFAKFSECSSLSQLRKAFGSYIPQALLDRRPSGDNSRRRIFSLDVVFRIVADTNAS